MFGVYTPADNDLLSQRAISIESRTKSFADARKSCLANGGDLQTPDSSKIIDAIISSIPVNSSRSVSCVQLFNT